MPLYEISAPDGKTYQIEGPPDASDADVARAVLAQFPEAGKAPFVAPLEDPGFFKALGTALTSTVKSMGPGLGLMADPGSKEAAASMQQVQDEAANAYRRTEFSEIGQLASEGDIGGALGATWSKFRELAGESIGFQAPAAGVGLAAAGAAALAPAALPAAAIGTAAYGLTLLGQYISSNLGRQLEENKGKPIERLDATVAGVGQSALDLLGGKFVGLGKILGLEGKKASEMALKELTEAAANPIKYGKEAGKGGVKGIAFEVPQEVTQSVLERWQAGLEIDPFKDPGAAKEYAEAAAGALMLGGPLGAVGQVGARRAERAEAIGELQSRAEADALARKNILESEEYKNAPYEERFTGIPPEFGPIPASAQRGIFTEELPPSLAPSPTQAAQDIAIAEQEAAKLEEQKQELLRVRGILDREMQRAPLTAARIGQVAPKDALKTQIAEVDKQLDQINTQLKKATRAAGIKEPTKRETRAAAQQELAPSQYFREYGAVPEEPVPTAVEQENLQLTESNALALFKPNKKGASNLSVKSTNLYKALVGLDLTTDEGRRTFKTLLDEAYIKKIGTLDFTAAENLYNAALDFGNRAFERTLTPKTRLTEPTVIGQQETAPATPEIDADLEVAFAQQRRDAGMPLTPRQEYLLKERENGPTDTPSIITPEQNTPKVGGYPLLARQKPPTKKQQAAAQQSFTEPFDTELVTSKLADDLGIPKTTTPAQALRQALYGGKDLNDEADAHQVWEAFTTYRDSGAVPQKQKENINRFLRGSGLVEQQEFDFTTADQGAPNVRPETGTSGEGVVASVQPKTAEGQRPAGAGPADVAGTEGPVDTDIGGERGEQRALSAQLRGILERLNIPRETAKQLVESYTDEVTSEIDVKGLQEYIEKEFGLNLNTPPVGSKLSDAAAKAAVDNDIRGTLRAIAKTGSTPLVRMVAQKLLAKVGGTKIQVSDTPGSGMYDPITDTIYINPNALTEHTVLHEVLHAAISHVIRNRFHPLTQQLAALYEKVAPRLHGLYGAQDVQEFAAESQSNPEFREALKNIPLPQGALKTAWDHVVNAVRRFLGMAPRESKTTLDKVDRLIDNMLTIAEAEPRQGGNVLLNFGQSGKSSFDPSKYREPVMSWAKNHFGERTAPNGKPVWQNFVQWFGDSKVVDEKGEPLVVYRGGVGDGSMSEGFLNGQPRDGYAVFTSTSPHVAASYAHPDTRFFETEVGAITPLYVKAGTLVEFPVGRRFDKFEFDRQAKRLKPGQVLVARGVNDQGPRTNLDTDPDKLYSYGSDIYAFNTGTSVKSVVGNAGDFREEAANTLFLNADVSGAAAAYKDFLNQTGAATRALPGMSPQWVDKVGGLSRSLVSMITKTLDLNHLVEIYGNRVPALRGMVNLLNEKRGFENTQLDLSAQISKELGKARENYVKTAAGRTTYDKFTKVIYDSTINLYDPSNPDEAKTNKLKYGEAIQSNYNSLPDDLKQLYKKIKDNYTRLFQYYIAGLEKDLMGLDEKERKEIIEGIKSRITPYFPLMRFGDYWLEFEKADQTGEKQRYVHAFESPEARARFIKDAKIDTKSPGFKIFTKLEEVTAGKVPPSEPMIRRTLKALKEQGMDQDSIDRVYRELLKMYPQQSAILNMIRRESVPGYEMDVLRSFNEMTPKLIRQSASRLYNRNVEEIAGLARAQLQEISATDPRGYSPLAEAVARELSGGQGSRLETILNPRMSSLASAVNWLTYGYFMGGNVSTALINMTQTAMVAYPILAAEMGPIKAASALMSASKFYGKHAYKNPMENWKKYGYLSPLNTMSKTDPLYKLYEELQRRGQINISISQEILDLQATRGEPASKLKRAVNFAMSAAHQHTEMANREITAIAAYRLAKEKGKSEQDAVNYAVDIVTKSHGSGMLDTAGPIFQHPYGRVVLMFKRFSQLMLFRAARTMYVAISGDSSLSPQEQAAAKSLARKQLIGIYTMAFAFSGAQGLPLFGIVEMLYNVLQAAFGDDNEYADFQQEVRDAVSDFGLKGPVNALLNLEIAQRTGFGDLLIRDDSRSKAELGALRYYIEQFFGGAPLSMLTGMSRGFSMINDGNIERGLEAMLPVAIRNGFKATRFMTEGARTLKGDPIDEDIGLYNSLFQAAGFAPADLTDIYAKRGYAKEMELFIKTRKSRLLDQYEIAMGSGDSDAMSSVQDKIAAFNNANPEERITGDTIRKSINGRRRREQQAIYGVQISPKLRSRIAEEIGYEQ